MNINYVNIKMNGQCEKKMGWFGQIDRSYEYMKNM